MSDWPISQGSEVMFCFVSCSSTSVKSLEHLKWLLYHRSLISSESSGYTTSSVAIQ